MKYLIALLVSFTIFSCSATQPRSSLDSAAVQSFDTPDLAIQELLRATAADDLSELKVVLGSDILALLSEDEKQSVDARKRTALTLANENIVINLTGEKGARQGAILLGDNEIEFPIPLIERGNKWQFDTLRGLQVMQQRAIRRNEMDAIENLMKLRDAEKVYFSRDWDGDGTREYASQIKSKKGKDGLCWQSEDTILPLRAAQAEGNPSENPSPISGYAFKIFTSQGEAAKGGKKSYLVKDNLLHGYAALAYPIYYGRLGKRSFMIDFDGNIYRADLGQETLQKVEAINEFNPDSRWKIILSPN